MNGTITRVGLALSMLIIFVISITDPRDSCSSEPAVAPAATEILKRMTDYLGHLEQFSVQTQNTLEDVYGSGHRIDLDVAAKVIVSRPNKIRSERKGDLVDQIFYYDGKSLTLFSPTYNVYATEDAPDTFYGLFQFLYEKIGFGLPITDLVYSSSYQLLMQDVTLAQVLGSSYIGGIKCTHLLFSRPGVDFQLWITESTTPLPLKYVVTDTSTPDRLSISTRMTNWNVELIVDESQFTFVQPENAEAIDFIFD